MLEIKVCNYQTGEFREEILKAGTENGNEWIVGRASNCDIVLSSQIVSRVHGRISFQNGQYWFTDFGSTDGSRINNSLIEVNQRHALHPDDLIRIGEHVLVVEKIDTSEIAKVSLNHSNSAFQSWEDDLSVQCVRVIQETEDVKTFCFATDLPIQFNYLPGQFITLDLDINGEKVQRCYSISSSPSRPNTLEITVKRVPAPNSQPDLPPGLVSNWLHDHITVGSTVRLKGGALGKFTCTTQPPKKLLLISAGSGITPMISMAKWICDTAADCDVVFLHSARTPQDIIMRHELELLAARHPNFRLVATVTQSSGGASWYGLVGRLNEAMLTATSPDFQERMVYVCGPHAFMESTKSLLQDLGFPMGNYHEESFGGKRKPRTSAAIPPRVSVMKPSNGHNVASDSMSQKVECHQDALGANQTDAPSIIAFTSSQQEAVSEDGLSILEVAEQEGIRIRSSCKQGICGACRVRKVEGTVSYETEPEALDDRDRDEGYILPCIASAVGRVVIEA